MDSYEYYKITKGKINLRYFYLLKAKEIMETFVMHKFSNNEECPILKGWAEELYANSKKG
jgi:hypothetical protein